MATAGAAGGAADLDLGLALLTSADPTAATPATSVLIKLLSNIRNKPDEPKYRTIKRDNARIATVLAVPGAEELLLACGFVNDPASATLTLPGGSVEGSQLEAALQGLKDVQSALGVSAGLEHPCPGCRVVEDTHAPRIHLGEAPWGCMHCGQMVCAVCAPATQRSKCPACGQPAGATEEQRVQCLRTLIAKFPNHRHVPRWEYQAGLQTMLGIGVPQNPQAGMRLMRQSALGGYSVAEAALAQAYQKGMVGPPNPLAAAQWYTRAAEKGHVVAQNNLANCYSKGEGVAQDYAAAAKWYRKSAESGYSLAQAGLARLYYYGFGVEVDMAEAKKWWEAAAAQGDEHSAALLAQLF